MNKNIYELRNGDESNFITGKQIGLAFEFKVNKFGWSNVYMEILDQYEEVDEKLMLTYFFQDLYMYLHKNKHQPKWDFNTIHLSGFNNLKLMKKDQIDLLKKELLTITNFDIVLGE
ncbi:hypothetical protein EI74_0831 [Mycoplasma testudineum]|uniref:Uncharacterized protein n=1 Tax=Mycoplasma testudineum TaxID=244584 RepID=A0A4R6IBK2_9MOLU|nr:hypothetical protein [Mycoplasma testudineum]OYD26485.1 hypothetical protein CG473_03810 [Mycoplasma testudineum]TDO18951.1 hypothetical protein EI74_0831 [Mycoplasma testudineum]